jgi:transposase-like protein
MGRAADTGLADLWEQRIERQRRSRLSIAEFCRQEGVSPASFYAWRQRLPDANSSRLGSSETRSPLFVPIELPTSALAGGSVRIELPGGAVLQLPTDISAELLTTAIGAVLVATSGRERAAC